MLLRICSAHLGTIRETVISLGRRQLIQRHFCVTYGYVGKEDLSKGYLNRRRKFGVTTHFSEN